jgi:hypothetical protein
LEQLFNFINIIIFVIFIMDFGIRCSQAQMRKLKNGGAILIRPDNMDETSPIRMMLCPQTGRRLNTAMRKNKGLKIALKPDEDLIDAMTGGSLKSIGKKLAKTLIPVATDVVLPTALGGLSMALGDPTGISGAVASNLVKKLIDRKMKKKGQGVKPKKIVKKISKFVKKIGKNPLIKELGKTVLEEGASAVGDALTAYTGNPAASMALEKSVKKSRKLLKENKGNFKEAVKSTAKDIKRAAVEEVDDWVDKNLTGIERDIAQGALAGKYPTASDLVYDYANSKTEQLFSGYGVPKKTRGGIRMGKGMANLTPTYDVAMRSVRTTRGGMLGMDMRGGMIQLGSPSVEENSPAMTPFLAGSPQLTGGMIQLGSPYVEQKSPSMNPFLAGSPQLSGFKEGGSFLAAGERRRGGSFLMSGI